MSLPTIAELGVWAAVGVLLISILLDDLKNYRIRNKTVLMLAGLFVVWCAIRADLSLFVGHLIAAASIFAILAVMYRFRMMGGGDVKLLTTAFLWLGLENGFLFSVLLSVAALVYVAAAKLRWVPSRAGGARTKVPFGPSIAIAWIATMLLVQGPRVLA